LSTASQRQGYGQNHQSGRAKLNSALAAAIQLNRYGLEQLGLLRRGSETRLFFGLLSFSAHLREQRFKLALL